MNRLGLHKRLWKCTDCSYRIRDRYEKDACPNCVNGHLYTLQPLNGETVTLIADGGQWCELIPCDECNGSGIELEVTTFGEHLLGGIKCHICSGDGVMSLIWHRMHPKCPDFDKPAPTEMPDWTDIGYTNEGITVE